MGHQPDMGELLSWMLGREQRYMDMKKGAVACMKFDDITHGQGELEWLSVPSFYG